MTWADHEAVGDDGDLSGGDKFVLEMSALMQWLMCNYWEI